MWAVLEQFKLCCTKPGQPGQRHEDNTEGILEPEKL